MYKLINVLIGAMLFSCTISLQNISTNGRADDVVQDQFETSPEVNAKAELPLIK